MIIVLFHVLYLVGKFVFRRYNGEDSRFFGLGIMDQQQQQRNADEEEDKDEPAYVDVGAQSKAMKDQANLRRRCSEDDAHEEASSKIRFSPPAFIQRYQAVQEVLMDKRYGGKLKKVHCLLFLLFILWIRTRRVFHWDVFGCCRLLILVVRSSASACT